MGTTIHYSGTLDDMNRVEEMEDQVMDLVFALVDEPPFGDRLPTTIRLASFED